MRFALVALGLTGCAPPHAPWQIAAVYDATALGAPVAPEQGYLWTAAPGMAEGCGPTWAPVGLGVMDAEAISADLTPTLAILLAGDPDLGPLARGDVQVVWTADDGTPRKLEPAVLPPALRVSVADVRPEWGRGAAARAVARGVCLEHKIGRAWVGGDDEQQRTAFLHDVRAAADPRAWFLGQGAPIPALLGPPYACLDTPPAASPARPEGLDAEPRLQVGDVWNAALPACDPAPAGTRPPNAGAGMPLAFGWTPASDEQESLVPEWHHLQLAGDASTGIVPSDPLAEVPLWYPGGIYDPFPQDGSTAKVRLVLLLVPAWQFAGEGAGTRLGDPVGDTLADLSRLSVGVAHGVGTQAQRWDQQVAGWKTSMGLPCWVFGEPDGRFGCSPTDSPEVYTFHELNPYNTRPWAAALTWGYPYGALPESVLGGAHALDATAAADAHRAGLQGLIRSLGVLLAVALLAAAKAIPDLWRRWPEVSLDRWTEKPARREP